MFSQHRKSLVQPKTTTSRSSGLSLKKPGGGVTTWDTVHPGGRQQKIATSPLSAESVPGVMEEKQAMGMLVSRD